MSRLISAVVASSVVFASPFGASPAAMPSRRSSDPSAAMSRSVSTARGPRDADGCHQLREVAG